MSNGSLSNDEIRNIVYGEDGSHESSAADNTPADNNELPAQPGIAVLSAAGKDQKHGKRSSLSGQFREKLELYARENTANPLNRKKLRAFYNNTLTPDERRFVAGTDYAGAGDGMNRIIDKLCNLIAGETSCAAAGTGGIMAKLKSCLPGIFIMDNEDISQHDNITGETESLFFPLTLRVEDMIIPGNEILWNEKRLPELKDFKGRTGYLMLGDRVLSTGKIIAGEDELTAFEVGDISLDRGGRETPLLTELLLDYPLNLSVETGRKYLPAGDAACLGPGSIIEFEKSAGEPVDIVLDDYDMVIARGEVVVLDEYFGIRITDYCCGGISGIMNFQQKISERRTDEFLHVPLRCVLGRRKITLKDFTGLGEGSVIGLDSTVFSPVEVLVAGDIKLKGEVVVIRENFGVRIVDENRGSPLRGDEYEDIGGDDESPETIEADDTSAVQKPFAFLEGADPGCIVNFLQGEHPQAIALILSFLSPSLCGNVMSNLPHAIQGDVALRMAVMKSVSPDVVSDIEKVLARKISILSSADFVRPGGIDSVVEMINMTDRGTEKIIIESIEENNPELAEEIKRRLFVFEDIALLDDRSVQKILREVDTRELAMSMKGAGTEVQEKIFRNMSKRASSMLREDLDFMGPVRLRDVEESQQKIINIIRKLEDAGEIIIARPGEDGLVV